MRAHNLLKRTEGVCRPACGLLATIPLLLLVLFPGDSARAATPDIQLEITPSTVQLAPGEETDVLMVVRNASSGSLQEMELSWFTDVGVSVTSGAVKSGSLAPDGSTAWPIHVTRSGDGLTAGDVHFQLSYLLQMADASQTLPGVVVGTLQIQERSLDKIDEIAEVQIETALELLEEHRPGIIFLIVKNKSDVPLRIVSVVSNKPDFIELEVPDLGAGAVLGPQDSQALAVVASASDAVQAGAHMLLFEIELEWEKSGRVASGSLVATQKLNAGILGESDILKLIGVPSFLLVPGFLMTMTFMMLWSRVQPKRPEGKLPLDAKSAEFWLIAITLSILAAPVYTLLTEAFGSSRNYLEGYGLRDVFWVWIGSLAAAILGWLLVVGGGRISVLVREQLAASRARRTFPTKRDTPIQVMTKLERLEARYPPRLVHVDLGGPGPESCFLLMEVGDKQWVAPAVELAFTGLKIPQKYTNDLDEILSTSDDYHAVVDILNRGEEGGEEGKWLTLDWKATSPLQGPRAFPKSKVEQPSEPEGQEFIGLPE